MAIVQYIEDDLSVYEVEGEPKFSELKELIRVLEEESAKKVRVELDGCVYTFNTKAERTAWALGFEAAWELIDALTDVGEE
jgi:hypothetical protein